MRILVTGGLGFIGSHLVNNLCEKNHEVLIIDDFSTGSKENLQYPQQVEVIKGCITDFALVEKSFRHFQPEGIVHLAAIASVEKCQQDPLFSGKVNLEASLFLIELCLKMQIKKFVFASSAAVYDNQDQTPKHEESSPVRPISFYGLHKFTVEQTLQLYSQQQKLQGTSFRFFNVFGPNQDPRSPYSGVLSIFMNKIVNQENPQLTIFGDGEQTRDFIFVKDIVKAIQTALTTDCTNGQVINLGTARSFSLLQIVQLLREISGKDIQVLHETERVGDIRHSQSINQKMVALGWEPDFSLHQGLSLLYQWAKESI